MAYPLTEKVKVNDEIGFSVSPIGYVLIFLRALGIILSFFICISIHGLWRLFRLPSPWPRYFLWMVSLNGGALVKTRGQRLKKDVFYASNHISWFDIPVISGQTGCTFIAHDGIANWPIIGTLCRINKTIFVSRTDRMKVGGQIEVIREALEEQYPITVFPEGTTTNGESLLPFKPSLFQAMAPPPKPIMIQPILLDYGNASADIAWIGDQPVSHNAMNLFGRLGLIRATLHFLEPFDPAVYGDRKTICAEAEKRIKAALSASRAGKPVV